MIDIMKDMRARVIVCYEIFDDPVEAHDEAWRLIYTAWRDRDISNAQKDALILFNDKYYEV